MINDFIEFARSNNFDLKIDDDNELHIDDADDDKSHIACYLLMLQVQKKYNFNIDLRMSDYNKKIIHAVNDEFYDTYNYNVDFMKHDDHDTLHFEFEDNRFVCVGVGSDF